MRLLGGFVFSSGLFISLYFDETLYNFVSGRQQLCLPFDRCFSTPENWKNRRKSCEMSGDIGYFSIFTDRDIYLFAYKAVRCDTPRFSPDTLTFPICADSIKIVVYLRRMTRGVTRYYRIKTNCSYLLLLIEARSSFLCDALFHQLTTTTSFNKASPFLGWPCPEALVTHRPSPSSWPTHHGKISASNSS